MSHPKSTPASTTGRTLRAHSMHAEAHADGLVHVFNGRGPSLRHTVMTPEQARGIAASLQRAADEAQASSAGNARQGV